MSQCVSCSNQPGTNDSLGGAAHEGTVTPMVIGIIVGTVIVFLIVVCALFYCVKLENRRYMAKVEEGAETEPPPPPPAPSPDVGSEGDGAGAEEQFEEQRLEGRPLPDGRLDVRKVPRREMSVKSRPASSVTVSCMQEMVEVPARSPDPGQEEIVKDVEHHAAVGGTGGGKKRSVFGWGKKARNSVPFADNTPVTAIEMV